MIVHLLNPRILREVPEDVFVDDMESLEGRWKPEEDESQIEENLGADPLEDDDEEEEEEEFFDSEEELMEE